MRAIWQLCLWKLVKNSFLPETTLATTKNVHELIFWTIIGFLKLVAIKFGSISSSLPFLPTMGLYSVFAHQVLFKSHDLTWKDIQMQNLVAISLSNKTNTSTGSGTIAPSLLFPLGTKLCHFTFPLLRLYCMALHDLSLRDYYYYYYYCCTA